MIADDPLLRERAREALTAAGGDESWAVGLLRRWLDESPALRRQLIAWGSARGWWTADTWGAETGLWDASLRSLVQAEADRQAAFRELVELSEAYDPYDLPAAGVPDEE